MSICLLLPKLCYLQFFFHLVLIVSRIIGFVQFIVYKDLHMPFSNTLSHHLHVVKFLQCSLSTFVFLNVSSCLTSIGNLITFDLFWCNPSISTHEFLCPFGDKYWVSEHWSCYKLLHVTRINAHVLVSWSTRINVQL